MVIVEVFNKIFIGNIHDANDVYKLLNLGIGGVLSCVYCSNLDWCDKDIKNPKIFFKHDLVECKKKLSRITGKISQEELKEEIEEEGKGNEQKEEKNDDETEDDETEHIGKDHPDYYFTNCAHYDFVVFAKEIKTEKSGNVPTYSIVTSLKNLEEDQILDFCDEDKEKYSEEIACNVLKEEKEIYDSEVKGENVGEAVKNEENVGETEKKEENKKDQLANMLKCEEATNNNNYMNQQNETDALSVIELNEYIRKNNTIPLKNVYKIKHLYLDINDSYDENILKFVEKAHEFIDSVIAENKNILIHCLAGISRCSTIILSYISKKNKKGINENFTLMKKKYPFACPNNHFFQQLLLYEKMNYNLNGYSKYHQVFKQLKCKFDNKCFQYLSSLNLLNEKDPINKFQCKFCRFPLFNNNDIVEHDFEQYNIKKSWLKKKYGDSCTSIFINKPVWLSTEKKMKGVIYCPNSQCKMKLGKWSWTGICCSCGYLQFSAFMINESNIDRINVDMS